MAGRIVGDTLEVTYDLDPDVCRVRVDPAQIQQVLLNLLANAADATAGHGSIVVRTANAAVAARRRHEDGALRGRVGRGLRCGPRRGRDRESLRAVLHHEGRRPRRGARVWRRRTGSRGRAAARSSSTARPAAARSSRSICPKRAAADRKGDGKTRFGVRRASRFAVVRNVVLGAFGRYPAYDEALT